MKEQPIETREHVIGHSIGQRPIHTSYEPPGPMPQFRPRPKVSPASPQPQPQPVPKRLLHVASGVKTNQKASPEVSVEKETIPTQKSS